jgi:hypothetical protein
MGRGGSSITFGKIQVVSEGESLDKLYEIFNKVMKEQGYPESKVVSFDNDDDDNDEKEDGFVKDEDGNVMDPDDSIVDDIGDDALDDVGADLEPVDEKKSEALIKKISSAPWMRRKSG